MTHRARNQRNLLAMNVTRRHKLYVGWRLQRTRTIFADIGSEKKCNRFKDEHLHHDRERLKEALEDIELKRVSENTYARLLKECIRLKALAEGKQLHAYINASALGSNIFLANTLVDMYAKFGDLSHALQVFDNMSERNIFSWNIIIAAYAKHGQNQEALFLFTKLQEEGIEPDTVTFVTALKACVDLRDLERGKQVHKLIKERQLENNVFVGNTLIDMYAKCGNIFDAWEVFAIMPERNIVSWTTMISGYVEHSMEKEAIDLFKVMDQRGVKPNRVTFLALLKACSNLANLEEGRRFHGRLKKAHFDTDVTVGSTLIDMYSKCGSLQEAIEVFKSMPKRNIVTWNAMIAGYSQHGHGLKAISLLKRMPLEGVQPNEVTFTSLIKACTVMKDLENGKQIHECLKKEGFESDLYVGSILIDMYAKCGSIENAEQVFERMPVKNVISWNTMIAGYAHHGHWQKALVLFQNMKEKGLQPDNVTFTSVISACSHSGLVDEGRAIFGSISKVYGLKATAEHYASMVDMLGRWGHLIEALNLIQGMDIPADVPVWMALLNACNLHRDLDIARLAFENVVKLEPQKSGAFVLLSNMYAAVGRWDDVEKLRKQMSSGGMPE